MSNSVLGGDDLCFAGQTDITALKDIFVWYRIQWLFNDIIQKSEIG